jgi:hypothetical protein
MNLFYLILIFIWPSGEVTSDAISIHTSMEECFIARDDIVEIMKRPIINYQAICVIRDEEVRKNGNKK